MWFPSPYSLVSISEVSCDFTILDEILDIAQSTSINNLNIILKVLWYLILKTLKLCPLKIYNLKKIKKK
jgi:hypothetical protein